jgi:hypothetical protein
MSPNTLKNCESLVLEDLEDIGPIWDSCGLGDLTLEKII